MFFYQKTTCFSFLLWAIVIPRGGRPFLCLLIKEIQGRFIKNQLIRAVVF